MSSALMMIDVVEQPKSKSVVRVRCTKCKGERSVVYAELIRTINKQILYQAQSYHCPQCFRSLETYRNINRQKSLAALSDITAGSSERSRALWDNPEYRSRCTNRHTSQTKQKLSRSIKQKFATDQEYTQRISEARKAYWLNPEYAVAKRWSADRFIAEATKVHGPKYDYTKANYRNFKNKIIIICKQHGEFVQLPSHHIHFANGCPQCSFETRSSKQEDDIIKWLEEIGVTGITKSNRTILGGCEIDIYIEPFKFGIEYHGVYWHSFDTPETGPQRYKHHFKSTLAERHGVQLFQIYDIEWLKQNDIVKSMIASKLGKTTRLYARKFKIVELSETEARDFFNTNHLQGHRQTASYYGLSDNNRIFCAISLGVDHGRIEIIRFANLLNHTVIGGLSKLIKTAVNRLGIKEIFTFADRRYSQASAYKTVGFTHLGITPPGYKYFKANRLYSRNRFQKHKLAKLLDVFDDKLSESQNMFNNGYRRIWDAGHHRLIYTQQVSTTI